MEDKTKISLNAAEIKVEDEEVRFVIEFVVNRWLEEPRQVDDRRKWING